MDDHNAISRIKQGDLNGLEILVNQYQARAVHAAYLVLYDRGLAEDVVQTAFVKVAERIHQYDNERPFAPWFFRIVVNESLKVSKKQNRQVSLDRKVDEPTLQLANWLAESDPNPELLVEQREIRQMILKAIRSLPPGQRASIVMRYFLDMSMAEISADTGRPLSTVKWWLRDGRRRLKNLINIPGGG
ncbi:MAG: sigma-70 family RNA polymerase sigma factor [Chloroflexota bacterium]|nr:MAG: sigma-70 family RNA polymerase sigma factor [Chloroflexota bacterium]